MLKQKPKPLSVADLERGGGVGGHNPLVGIQYFFFYSTSTEPSTQPPFTSNPLDTFLVGVGGLTFMPSLAILIYLFHKRDGQLYFAHLRISCIFTML